MDRDWPNEAWRRRVVLVLGDSEVDLLRHEGGGRLLVDDTVHVFRFPPREIYGDTSRLGTDVYKGDVFIQSPYDGERYERAGGCARSFSIEKCTLVCRLCQLLGARRIRYERTSERFVGTKSSRSTRVSGQMSAGDGERSVGGGVSWDHASDLVSEVLKKYGY